MAIRNRTQLCSNQQKVKSKETGMAGEEDFPCQSGIENVVDSSPSTNAVLIRNACKSYGVGKWSSSVLRDLNMTIPKGSIYGLLGASGCGKTTLLSCIVGQRSLDRGQLLIFGEEPNLGTLGRRVGHMPQELGLCTEFTIREAIEYFGCMYNLPSEFVKSQTDYFLKLLDLPSASRRIGTLSGGQQRRVSFAVAIFHEPELLILDEPTVGVDSILRQKIWGHLIRLNRETRCTVVITTHYLEEASHTALLGMMRSGRILVEDSPSNLVSTYNVSSLDDVFLQLCIEDDHRDKNKEINITQQKRNKKDTNKSTTKQQNSERSYLPSSSHLKALLYKNYLITFRNLGLIFIVFFFPCLAIVSFFSAIGQDPTSLKLAVVNSELELNNVTNCADNFALYYPSFSMLSCRYLHHLNNATVIQVPFHNLEEAIRATKEGQVWGVVQFSGNFSEQLIARIRNGVNNGDLENIMSSQIGISLDESNHLIKRVLVETTIKAYEKLFEEMQREWSYEPGATTYSIKFLEAVNGKERLSFVDFVAPGLILNIMFFNNFAQLASFIIAERNQGLFHRSIIAGANITEMILAHLIIQFSYLIGQVFLVYTLVIMVFKIYCKGSLALAIFITMLEGFSSMSFGVLLSGFCSDLNQVLGLTVASNLLITLIGGIIWPLESMPSFLRYVVYFLPETYPIVALRNVFGFGGGLDHPDVLYGILSSLGWITAFSFLSVIVIRKSNK